MIYTLDTNFFIDAARIHFPVEDHSDFWEWLAQLGRQNIIKVASEVYNEVERGNDPLADWLKNQKEIFTQKTSLYIHNLPSVLKRYGSIDEATLDQLKADPYVIAHALLLQGCVVTGERPNNATAPHNKYPPA